MNTKNRDVLDSFTSKNAVAIFLDADMLKVSYRTQISGLIDHHEAFNLVRYAAGIPIITKWLNLYQYPKYSGGFHSDYKESEVDEFWTDGSECLNELELKTIVVIESDVVYITMYRHTIPGLQYKCYRE